MWFGPDSDSSLIMRLSKSEMPRVHIATKAQATAGCRPSSCERLTAPSLKQQQQQRRKKMMRKMHRQLLCLQHALLGRFHEFQTNVQSVGCLTEGWTRRLASQHWEGKRFTTTASRWVNLLSRQTSATPRRDLLDAISSSLSLRH